MTEDQLIQGCINNDRQCQRKLYDRYQGRMYSICLRYCKDVALANDALQEGFIKVFKNIKSFRKEGDFTGWIRKIIVRSSVDQIRKETKHWKLSIEEVDQTFISIEIDTNFDKRDYEKLLGVLEKLPPGYRLVFFMNVIDEMSHQEIGEALNISENTSRSQLFRARKLLKEILIESNPPFVQAYLQTKKKRL